MASAIKTEHGARPSRGRPGSRGPVRVLITDIDNTVYNWVDYFAPAFRAMVHYLAREADVSENVLIQQFGILYDEHGTTEYPFTVQRLPALAGLPVADKVRLAEGARLVFGRSRRRRLRAYAGVKETLEWLQQLGVAVIATTSTPRYVAVEKLRALGILSYYTGVVAWKGFSRAEDPVTNALVGDTVAREPHATRFLGSEHRKPNPEQYLLALGLARLGPHEAAVVGDSLSSDIAPAMDLGMRAYFAQYGLVFEKKNLETIERVTPGGREVVKHAYRSFPVPDGAVCIRSFADLRLILPVAQTSLF